MATNDQSQRANIRLSSGETFNVVSLLSTTTGINLAGTGGVTQIYQAPINHPVIVTDVIVEITGVIAYGTAPQITVGRPAGNNDWIAGTLLVGLNTVGQFSSLSENVTFEIHNKLLANQILNFAVPAPSTSGALQATVYVLGFII